MWEKSNFSFSHSGFNGFVLQTSKNQGLFGKGLNLKEMAENCPKGWKTLGKGEIAPYK